MNDQKLIECVRAHECLYDQSIREYRKRDARCFAWKKVAKEMNSTASECKKHWNNLRNAYLHAVSRRRRPGNFISKWRCADEMSFLLPFITPKQQQQPAELQTQASMADVDAGCNNISPKPNENVSANDANSEVTDDDRMSSTDDEAKPMPQPNENISETALLLEVIKRFKEPEKDAIDSFFACMAHTVKTFPVIEQIHVKRRVFEAVHAVEWKLLKMGEEQRRMHEEEQRRMHNGFGDQDHVVTDNFNAPKLEVDYL